MRSGSRGGEGIEMARIEDTAGNKRFFIEGCSYCHMSTGGVHEHNCPMEDRPAKIPNIRQVKSLGAAWQLVEDDK